MYTINKCLACGSKNIVIKSTKLARFVAWKTSNTPMSEDIDIEGLQCNDCSYVGSNHRFTIQEEHNLYNQYRGPEYNSIRYECEPNYIKIDKFIKTNEYFLIRKTGIDILVEKNIDTNDIKSLLDYGGEAGSMIPSILNKAKKYVFDISDVPVQSNVIKLKQIDLNNTFDFVMCCHVLEHVSDLDTFISNFKKVINKNTWIYFEVPNYPNPFIGKFHEHINFFNKKSFTSFLVRNEFCIKDTYEYNIDVDMHHFNNLCMMVKLNE